MQFPTRARVVLAFLGMGFWLIGCTNVPSTSTPSPQPTMASTPFVGQELPSKVEHLLGTPFYLELIKDKVKLDGAAFLYLSPQDPTQALLVVDPKAKPDDLKKRESHLMEISGTTELVDLSEAATALEDKMGLKLHRQGGKIVVLRISAFSQISASPSPIHGVES